MYTILFVGNFFKSKKNNQNVWFEIPECLEQIGWKKMITSQRVSRPIRLVDMLWTIFSKRNSYDFALVDVFSGAAFIWAEMAAKLLRRLNKPFVLNLHGGNLPEFAKQFPRRVKRLLKFTNIIVSPSAYLQSQLKYLCRDIVVIPNIINIQLYPYRQRAKVCPELVWVRAFHKIYNPSLAPRVISNLAENWPSIHLTMVGTDKGDGSLKEMLDLANALGISDRIKMVGGVPREDVPKYLHEGDIFINTTNFDNTPVSVIEAMACGLPIISTNVGGIPWLVEDGVDGLLVLPNDAVAMAAAIKRVLTEPGLAGKLSQNARKKAEKFDWSIILPLWEEVFTSLIPE